MTGVVEEIFISLVYEEMTSFCEKNKSKPPTRQNPLQIKVKENLFDALHHNFFNPLNALATQWLVLFGMNRMTEVHFCCFVFCSSNQDLIF